MGSADGTEPITNYEDIIDSRDVIARIEFLETIADEQAEIDADQPEGVTLYGLDEDEQQELKDLKALAEQGENATDWRYGETLIRDSYFVEYAQQLAEDIGAIDREANWPNSYIDWEAAARDLQMDYTSVDFAGVTYWVR